MIEFPFEERYSDRLGKILKPIIPVTLNGQTQSVNVFMLLDSGADKKHLDILYVRVFP